MKNEKSKKYIKASSYVEMWESKYGTPHITYLDEDKKTPLWSMEFKSMADRDEFIKINKLNIVNSDIKSSQYIKSSADYDEDIRVYMNTWANYNEYGADGVLTPTGWMDVDEAREYAEKYADYEPFINDIDDYSGGIIGRNINEYSNVNQALDIIETYNNLDEDDRKVFAIIIDEGYDFDKAVEIVDDHDYSYYDANNPEDLGYYIIDELYGGDISALGDDVEYYFDFDAFGRDLRISGDVDYLFENDEGETDEEALQEFLDTHSDQEIGEYYVYDILGGMSELSKEDYENYFDYREFGETTIINDGLDELPGGGYLYVY